MELIGKYSTILLIDTLDIKKSTFYRHINNRAKNTSDKIKEKAPNKELLEQIKTLLKEHPCGDTGECGHKRLSDKQKEDLQADETAGFAPEEEIDSQSQKNSKEETES